MMLKRYTGSFMRSGQMVRIWAAGKLPELQHVAHTNFADHRVRAR